MTAATLYRRSPHVIVRRILDEDLLVPIRGELADMQKVFALNPVGAHVWAALEQARSTSELVAGVTDVFAVDPSTAEADVSAFLHALLQAGLVTDAPSGDAT